MYVFVFRKKVPKIFLNKKCETRNKARKNCVVPKSLESRNSSLGFTFLRSGKCIKKKQAKKPNHVNPGLSSLAQLLKIVRTFFVASNQRECKSENSVQLQETLRAKEKTNHSQTNKTFCVNSETRSFCAKPATVFVVRTRE